jgi:hypothetical protein
VAFQSGEGALHVGAPEAHVGDQWRKINALPEDQFEAALPSMSVRDLIDKPGAGTPGVTKSDQNNLLILLRTTPMLIVDRRKNGVGALNIKPSFGKLALDEVLVLGTEARPCLRPAYIGLAQFDSLWCAQFRANDLLVRILASKSRG